MTEQDLEVGCVISVPSVSDLCRRYFPGSVVLG